MLPDLDRRSLDQASIIYLVDDHCNISYQCSMSTTDWKARCAERKKKQLDSIPPEWLIQTAPTSPRVSNVLNVPIDNGLLTPREIEITETVDVEVLLQKLSSASWSSTEVTTAFYKRAVIAQQVVRILTPLENRDIAV
jgi:amidase